MSSFSPAEAAEHSGLSIDTLRYYEREGILPAVARTAGGRRTYTDDDLARLEFLRCLRETGMPIAKLRRYAELADLEKKLRAIYDQRKDKTMFIVAAGTLPYHDIVQVIDAAKGAGVEKVGIVTEGMRKAAGVPTRG